MAIARRLPAGAAALDTRAGPLADSLPAQLEPHTVEALLARGAGLAGFATADLSFTAEPADAVLRHATAIGLAPEGESPADALLVLAFSDLPMFSEDDLELLAMLGMAAARAADREIAFATIERSERMLAEAQRQAHLGSWEWDIAADTVTWSDELYRIFGLDPQSIPVDYGTFLARVHADDRERVSATAAKAHTDHRPFHLEHRIIREDGAVRTMLAYGSVETDPSGQPVWMLGTGQDISDRKLLEERLIHQAFRDALTGLANRALFTDRVKHALSRRATAARSLAVLYLDLDDFKNVNDTMGHGVGDEVLKTAATRIEASVRPSDTVARLGGDEFAVLLEDISDTGEAIPVADRILATLERPIVMLGRELTITASLGIATNAASSETPDDLMRNADVAMYRAKAAGRRRRELFDPQMLTVIIDRLTLAHELENVAERGELRLHFQPILALGEQRVTAVEALVRWQHPSRGLLNPATFISLAEETKHIIGLGRWVLREACQQAAGWAPNPDGTPIRVSVNVSALQLQDVELVSDVAAALRLAKLPADRLMLEITESVLVDDPESAVRRLQALKQLGVRLAIDDFGTGYSSLSYLTRFPIDTLKIDGSFVAALRAADDGNTVARTIVEIYGS